MLWEESKMSVMARWLLNMGAENVFGVKDLQNALP
jgi:hypothetical protein